MRNGATPLSTKVVAQIENDDHLEVLVSSTPPDISVWGDESYVIEMGGDFYTSGADITGVDATVNKYLSVYEVDTDENIVWYDTVVLKASDITSVSGLPTPVITIDPYNTIITNQDVTVTATTDNGTLNETSHTFTSNGSFEFVATMTDGVNTTVAKQTVTISNIDKTAPTIAIQSYDSVTPVSSLTVYAATDGGTLNAISHTFTSNGSFDFISIDEAGNVTVNTVTVSNITTPTGGGGTGGTEITGTVTGEVLLADGTPIQGLEVTLHSAIQRTFTDALGRFTFTNVPFEAHTIMINESGLSNFKATTLEVTVNGSTKNVTGNSSASFDLLSGHATIRCIVQNDNGGTTPGGGGTTPGDGGTTPGNGGGTTPGDGGGTPGNGGTTPSDGGTTPGNGGTTPGNGGTTPSDGGTTPGNGGTTPGNGGTPGTGNGGTTPGNGTTPGTGNGNGNGNGTTPNNGGSTPSKGTGNGGITPGNGNTPGIKGNTPSETTTSNSNSNDTSSKPENSTETGSIPKDNTPSKDDTTVNNSTNNNTNNNSNNSDNNSSSSNNNNHKNILSRVYILWLTIASLIASLIAILVKMTLKRKRKNKK